MQHAMDEFHDDLTRASEYLRRPSLGNSSYVAPSTNKC